MLPFNLTVFFAAMLIVRFYDKLTPQQIGRYGFGLCTVGLVWLAFVVHNDWSEVPVLFGLVLFGIGQGSLVTLVFNVLVTASPKELAGDVGSLRGTTQNFSRKSTSTVSTSSATIGCRPCWPAPPRRPSKKPRRCASTPTHACTRSRSDF